MTPLAGHAAEPVTKCAAEPTEMTISHSDVVDCAISPAGDQDIFYFDGKAKEVVVLSLLDESPGGCTNACPVAKLYAPGSSVALATFAIKNGDSDAQEVTLPKSGAYTVKVNEDGNNQTVDYQLGLERLFPVSPNASALVYGEFTGNLGLDPVLDQDMFTFSGRKDAVVTLSLGDSTPGSCGSGYHCPTARLYGPDQALVASFLATQTKKITLPQEGEYILWVSENGNNDTETYSLQLECTAPPAGSDTCEPLPPKDEPKCNGLVPTILGTDKAEKIVGTPANDVIAGLGGNDSISGLGGDDVICGNADPDGSNKPLRDADILLGNEGDDTLIGADGGAVLFGGAGADTLKGGKGRDGLYGGAGDDTLDGQAGDDVAIGGAGNDSVDGGLGRNDICDKAADDTSPAKGCEIKEAP